MKKKDLEKIKDKSIKDLQKEIIIEKNEIATLVLNKTVNPPKDSNIVMKKKKRLAVLLTIMNEKKMQGTV